MPYDSYAVKAINFLPSREAYVAISGPQICPSRVVKVQLITARFFFLYFISFYFFLIALGVGLVGPV